MSNNLFTVLKPTGLHSFILYILKAIQVANNNTKKAKKAQETLKAKKAREAKARIQEWENLKNTL
jgi:hypothetical protein